MNVNSKKKYPVKLQYTEKVFLSQRNNYINFN